MMHAAFDVPARAIRAAREVVAADSHVRAGIHGGECEHVGDDLGGAAVRIAVAVGGLAEAGEILVSQTVKDLVIGSGTAFADRGSHQLPQVPGQWRLFAVAGEEPRFEAGDSRDKPTLTDRAARSLVRHAPVVPRSVGSILRHQVHDRAD